MGYIGYEEELHCQRWQNSMEVRVKIEGPHFNLVVRERGE
jgi:hypothetical protein